MPNGIKRWWHNDDLLILQWVDDWFDEAHIRERRTMQEKWLVELLNPPIHGSYNQFGDKWHMEVGKPKPDEYVTHYRQAVRTAYKATVVMPDSSVDEDLFAQLHSWVKAGKLPDGRPLKKLCLIVQSREAALNIYDRIRLMGLSDVFYTGEDKILWNPFPDGMWVNE